MTVTRDQVRALDGADPLQPLRDRFVIPEGLIYLDGNSLGMLPKAAVARQRAIVEGEWGTDLIRSWNTHQWIDAPQRIGARIAPLIGAKPHEVIVADSVTVNLFKLITAAARPNCSACGSTRSTAPTSRQRSAPTPICSS